jgi:hypothetical protein
MNTALAVTKVMLIAYSCILGLLLVWVMRGRIPKEVYSRYSGKLIYCSRLPFTERWRDSVGRADLPAFLRARTRMHVFGLAGMVYFYFLFAYLLANEVVLCTRACGGG